MPSPRKAPTMQRFKVTMQSLLRKTRLLVMAGRQQVMPASLVPVAANHSRAPQMLLEGLFLRHRQPLSVALCAGAEVSSSVTRKSDDVGLGAKHDGLDVALRGHRQARRGRPIHGLGNVGELRQLCVVGVAS